jgi:hypothetical protein
MDQQAIKEQLRTALRPFIPRNATGYTYRVYEGLPAVNTLGFRMDPEPFEGKVVIVTDEAIILKIGRKTQFAVLDRSLVTTVPAVGQTVSVQPYARRFFNGQRADAPKVEVVTRSDGTSYTSRTMILGKVPPASLPIEPVECLELQQLIEQLEQMKAPDGHRAISHMLVDAKASDFSVVDPGPDEIFEKPPTISFTVSTRKFNGRVSVIYLRDMDVYAIELRRDGELLERIDDVYFDSLGEILATQIDDGAWRQIQVQPISTSKTKPH